MFRMHQLSCEITPYNAEGDLHDDEFKVTIHLDSSDMLAGPMWVVEVENLQTGEEWDSFRIIRNREHCEAFVVLMHACTQVENVIKGRMERP